MDKSILNQRIPINQIYQIAIRDEETSTQLFTSLAEEALTDIIGENVESQYYETIEFPDFSNMTYREMLDYLNNLVEIIGKAAERSQKDYYTYDGEDISSILQQLQDGTQTIISELNQDILDKYKDVKGLTEDNGLVVSIKDSYPTIASLKTILANVGSLLEDLAATTELQRQQLIQTIDSVDLPQSATFAQIIQYISNMPTEFQAQIDEIRTGLISYIEDLFDEEYSQNLTFAQIKQIITQQYEEATITRNIIMNGGSIVTSAQKIQGGTINE